MSGEDTRVDAAKILVVDDVALNVKLLADLLGAKGYRTCTAASGADALAALDREHPDLVLLDVMMPGMSGYEVCGAIRADPAHAMLPIVLVTALDPAKERAKGLDAGDAGHAAKVLVVDDVAMNVKLLADLLGAKGYRTCTAASGAEALAAVRTHRPQALFPIAMYPHRERVAAFALRDRLLTVGESVEEAKAGYVLTYGIDTEDLVRRGAAKIDKILRGERVGDVPIERPAKFRLIVNQKTARAIGVVVPPSLLARADEVIA